MKKNIYTRQFKIWSILLCALIVVQVVRGIFFYNTVIVEEVYVTDLRTNVMYTGDVEINVDNKTYYQYIDMIKTFPDYDVISEGDYIKFYTVTKPIKHIKLPLTPASKKDLLYYPIFSSVNILVIWNFLFSSNNYLIFPNYIILIGFLFNSIPLFLVNDWKYKGIMIFILFLILLSLS